VIEMNARFSNFIFVLILFGFWSFFPVSDDRSIELFRTRLETATQMQEVLSKDYRPNCLLIDEIDGAPAVIDFFYFYTLFNSI